MPKQRSTRNTPAKRRLVCKSATVVNRKQYVDGILSADEDVEKYLHLARGLVLAAWSDIIKGLIKKATSGSYQQAKLLLDFCDLTNVDTSKLGERDKQQLCDVLLEGLKLSSTYSEGQTAKAGLSQDPKNTGTL